MSAYVCNNQTFAALASFAANRRYRSDSFNLYPGLLANLLQKAGVTQNTSYYELKSMEPEDYASLVANILIAENVRSVNGRYNDNEKPHGLKFRSIENAIEKHGPIQLLKACDCLEYQSCETENYYDSLAYRVLNAIRVAIIKCLPGYDDAQWGIE